jgi:hypothetical protein
VTSNQYDVNINVTLIDFNKVVAAHKAAYAGLARDIAGFAANLLAGRAIGTSGQRR